MALKILIAWPWNLLHFRHALQRVKYGVVSLKRLHQDLLHWDDLYVAGRLHKPVIHILRGNLEVAQSISTNLDAALRLALLLLPPRFSERVR